jgi:hypothetical protein
VSQDVELAVAVVEVQRDRSRGPGGAAADLGKLEIDAVGMSIRTRCSSPVAGLTIGRRVASSTPGMATRARCASRSTSKPIGAKVGS